MISMITPLLLWEMKNCLNPNLITYLKDILSILSLRHFSNIFTTLIYCMLHQLFQDVECAWEYFQKSFLSICNKHAPVKTFRISGRDNPWISVDLMSIFRERNAALTKARLYNSNSEWITFRTLRNKCITLTRKAKSQFYFKSIPENLSNPAKFWKQSNHHLGPRPNQLCQKGSQLILL